MKRRVFCILFLIACFNIFAKENVYEDSFIYIELPETAEFSKINQRIVVNNNEYFLQINYSLKYLGGNSNFEVDLKIRNTESKNYLLDLLNDLVVKEDPSPMGMGEIYKYATKKGFKKLDNGIDRFATFWASSVTSDLLIYRKFLIDDNIFEEYLVEISNFWPSEYDFSYQFNNEMLDELIASKSPSVEKYSRFENKFIKTFKVKELSSQGN